MKCNAQNKYCIRPIMNKISYEPYEKTELRISQSQ